MYVALTRAKEQLILIGTVDKEEKLRKMNVCYFKSTHCTKKIISRTTFNLVYNFSETLISIYIIINLGHLSIN